MTDADEVTTYSGKAFDLPVLINRAIANVIPIPTLARLHDRARPGLHVDLHDCFKGTGAGISLCHLCTGLGIPVKQPCGDTVADFAACSDWTAIEDYCESAVIATAGHPDVVLAQRSGIRLGPLGSSLCRWCRETQGANAHLRDWPLPPAIK